MNRILSYRGLLASGEEDTILLSTIKGEKGYRIVKLQMLPKNFNVTDEYNVSVTKVSTTPVSSFDFSDNRLLGGAYFENAAGVGSEGTFANTVIFDNEIFNQDIFIGMSSQSGNACNYYLELEVIMLNETEATVATLKDIRNSQ